MATRAAITRLSRVRGTFEGVRHNKKSKPQDLGKALFNLFHLTFERDLPRMLRFLIDEHPAGWDNIVGANFGLPAGYKSTEGSGPKCYCHGSSSASPKTITPETAGEEGIFWVYAFDEENDTMCIFQNGISEIIAEVTLHEQAIEPDWDVIECGKDFERCEHYASKHFPAVIGTSSEKMSTRSYVGSKPLDIYDAIGLMINGIRVTLNGKTRGGNSTFLASGTLQGRDEPQEFNIGRYDETVPGLYKPEPGVQWVFPPTKNNPAESLHPAVRPRF